MGCRISRLGGCRSTCGDAQMSRVTSIPPSERRIDEFMKKNPTITLSLSQKELLMSGVTLDDIEAWTARKSFSSSECSFKSPEREDIWEEYDGDDDEAVAGITIDKLVQEAEHERKKDTEEQEEGEVKPGRMIGDFDPKFAFHGSPSFRVYCNNSMDNDEDSDFSTASAPEYCSEEPVSSAQPDSELLNSSEVQRTRESRRNKCRRKLKGVIGKGRPVILLLNVGSCYNPRSSKTSQQKLPEKAHSA